MCTIDKMLIKGIRSFSPDNKAVIQFYKPLTLIVGANGAGKTTIIECLKQACTGELPPNTRSGQSFVHDPKVAHETEVKAQIKLRFFTANGQEITVLRVFQLTQKKTKLEFKTLDCTMSTPNAETGQKTAVTYRCADIDKMVPSLMGVSKAVLENVIFVHQEESNWPLAEGKVLKERFDDIFAATKYTKALESLRKLRLEKTHEIKTLKLQLDHLRTHRDNATRLQEEIERAQEQINRHLEQAGELEQQVQDKAALVESLSHALEQLRLLSRDIQVANARLEELSKQARAKKTQLQDAPEFDESTEEIRDMLTAFDQRVDQERLQVSRLQREVTQRRQDLQAQNEVLRQASRRHSTLAAEKSAYDAAVVERDAFIRDTAPRVGISLGAAEHSPAAPLSESVVRGFEADLRQYVAQSEEELRRAKEASRAKDEELSARVDALTARLTAHQEQIKIKKGQIQKNKGEAEALTAQAESMVVNESMAVDAQRRVEAAQDALRAKTEEQNKAELDSKLAREKREIDEVEARIVDLRQERDRLSSASETATRLRLKSQDLNEKKEAMETSVRTRRVKLLQLLGPQGELPAIPQLRVRCETALAAKRRELETQQEQLTQQQMTESTAKAQLEAARAALSSAEGQRSQLLSQLRLKVQPAAQLPVVFEPGRAVENERLLTAALQAKKTAMDDCTRKLNNQEMMKKYFQRVRQLMCDNNTCPACYRGFASADELQSSLTQLDEDAQNYPAKVARLQTSADAATKDYQALAALQQTWQRVVDLETREIRDLKDRIPPLEEALGAATASVQESAEVLGAMQLEVNEASQLVTEAVWQIDRQHREVAALQEEVARLEVAVTASQTAGTGRTLSELDDAIELAELEKRNKEAAREMTLKRQNRLKEEILSRTRELSEAREALNQSKSRIDKKAELMAKADELQRANESLQTEIVRQEREGAPLVDEREAAVTNRTQMRTLLQAEVDQHEAKLRNAVQLMDSFNTKVSPVLNYEQKQGAASLARATIAVEEAQSQINKLNKDIETKEAEVRERSQTLVEQETLRHQMQDVLELRTLEEQLRAQNTKIEDLERQQQEIGQEGQLSTKLKAVEAERAALKQKLDMSKGARQAQQQTVERAQSQLRAPEYKDINQQYNKKYAEVLYTEMANSDLDKYHKALERALLSFHTTKMADINKIIKELWQKTYRGQDIDYIQIKADAEGTNTTSRSYNYRVVMYSGGAELEMRGRCSAGQKVLACLIIRLALAETFCLNCGILALDEPTTNLDADNALSLAEALRAIMVARRDQENFQLIVITHDENFAHQIGTREQAEFLWRVTKDDNQHTHLAQERIDDQ